MTKMRHMTARNWLPFLGFAVIAVFYYFLTWSPELPILGGDHPVYLLMADHLSLFAGRSPEITSLVMRYALFPPLYPLVLGMFGGTSAHVEVAHAITTTMLMAALVLYFVWVRGETRSSFKAFILSSIFAFLSTTLLQSFGILSENLYLLLTLAAIWFLNKPDAPLSRLYAAAIVVGLTAVTRSIGITMVMAFAVHLFLDKKDQRIRLILASLAPFVTWNILKGLLGYKGGYLWVVADLAGTRPLRDLLLNQLSIESYALWAGWISSFDHLPSAMTYIAGSAIGAICLAGTLHRAYLKKTDGIYTILYLGVLWLWPFSPEAKRFLYAVLPILLFHGFELTNRFLQRFSSVKILTYAYLLVIALMAVPATGSIFSRVVLAAHDENRMYANSPEWYSEWNLSEARKVIKTHKKLNQSWKRVAEVVPEKECVYHVDPPSLMLYANRRSYDPPLASTKEKFLKMANACRYFYVGSYSRIPYRQIFYPSTYIMGEGRTVFVEHMDDMEGKPLIGMLVEIPRKDDTTENRGNLRNPDSKRNK